MAGARISGDDGHPDLLAPPWASSFGEDAYGVWAEFDLGGVNQRMRWLSAGHFTMGSRSSEHARISDEVMHVVELSNAFWLADTTCTQALWKAVMRGNPSHLQRAEHPVENVSWHDCQRFLARAEELAPGISLRLPTEAEWEYGCRAGTHAPFWFGKSITTEQVNFEPYASRSPGLSAGRTVPVKSKPANGWGLYQMHGNVWEWCSDWYGPYVRGRQTDPPGPSSGEKRVIRGGSWFDWARGARSAQRFASAPDQRDVVLGFRLARSFAAELPQELEEKRRVVTRVGRGSGPRRITGKDRKLRE